MGDFFQKLYDKFNAVIDWFSSLFVNAFAALVNVLQDMVSWILDKLLGIALSAISSIDTSALSGINAWGSAPADFMNVLAVLGVGQAVAIITAAITIRLVLQLIPFVRLGS